MRKIIRRTLIIIGIIIVFFAGAFWIYTSDYYHAVTTENRECEVEKSEYKKYIVYGNINAENGFIFYPGGKVQAEAYEPMLGEIAKSGICCVLVKMPFNLAVFDIGAAQNVKKELTTIKNWYIGGHSLGGAMASSYVADNINDYSGLILMAAYPVKQLPDTFKVLSMYGSEDGVLNMEKYEKAKIKATCLKEIVIKGGNHGQFGNYGIQAKDKDALISKEEQWRQTANEVISFVNLK